MTRAARRFLIAVVERRVCEVCWSAPGVTRGWRIECCPCQCKRVDAERASQQWFRSGMWVSP